MISHVPVGSAPPERFEQTLERAAGARFLQAIEEARSDLLGVVVWNVNSTPKGGGVAEMLWSLLGYARGGRVDARWVTIGGNPDFFKLTKRLHNHLHGAPGDGGPLGRRGTRDLRGRRRCGRPRDGPVDPAGRHRARTRPTTGGAVRSLKDAGAMGSPQGSCGGHPGLRRTRRWIGGRAPRLRGPAVEAVSDGIRSPTTPGC